MRALLEVHQRRRVEPALPDVVCSLRRSRNRNTRPVMWRIIPLSIAALIFILDRVTKMWIENHVNVYDSFHVIPGFFDIVHTTNRGAAFGMFAETNHPMRTVLLIGV